MVNSLTQNNFCDKLSYAFSSFMSSLNAKRMRKMLLNIVTRLKVLYFFPNLSSTVLYNEVRNIVQNKVVNGSSIEICLAMFSHIF